MQVGGNPLLNLKMALEEIDIQKDYLFQVK